MPITGTPDAEEPEFQQLKLADGFSVYASPLASRETSFIYKEIFQDGCYDVARLPPDAFAVDAGAHIGLFTLYIKARYPSARILALEPAPATFAAFQRNMALHGVAGVDAHQCGLGRDDARQTLVFYPRLPGNATFFEADKRRFVETMKQAKPVLELLAAREEVDVEVRRLSGFLRRIPGLARIDLLKIDVEGGEVAVLEGLDEDQWELVCNVVLEVYNHDGGLGRLRALLEARGFRVEEQRAKWASQTTEVYIVVGRRESDEVAGGC